MSLADVAAPHAASLDGAVCVHCGGPLAHASDRFCCSGCAGAYALIHDLGLDQYYARRTVDPQVALLRPDGAVSADLGPYARALPNGGWAVDLLIDGMHCAACVWLIERVLASRPGVTAGRVNMTTRRLHLEWSGAVGEGQAHLQAVESLGYRLAPYDPACLASTKDEQERFLMRCLAVAAFAAGNIMLISFGIWWGHAQGMGDATRTMMHWVSALIGLPAVVYAGRPFFRSALGALRHGRTNMDVPISLGVVLATGMSLAYTIQGAQHAFFDSATMLLFFLLVGRSLDHQARGKARAAVERMVALRAAPAAVITEDGAVETRPADRIRPGELVQVATGERLPVDGVLLQGETRLDGSMITGEAKPVAAAPGAQLWAGMVNHGPTIRLRASQTGDGTLVAEMARLMEMAETRRGRFVALADRVARRYAPVVHVAALATFLGWTFGVGAPWQESLSYAVAVLIITCPCALALAVPAVQVLAAGALMRRGVLLKSPTALERLADADAAVLDKTGTLTLGRPSPVNLSEIAVEDVTLATSIALASRHPLARALVAAAPAVRAAEGVEEHRGEGLIWGAVRLGSRAFCGVTDAAESQGSELWLAQPGAAPVRFAFDDALRPDAAATVMRLAQLGLPARLLSGDRPGPVGSAARAVGIDDWAAEQRPADKAAALEAMRAAGRKPLMVGDGLNDAPALAAAHVSMSPASASDLSQTAADLVFQGDHLGAVPFALRVARKAHAIAIQNLILALGYNLIAVPLAIAGQVTPLIAALAMSSSSLLVLVNSFRVRRGTAS